ncbi:MAG: hypothetical protein RI942_1916 [Pseudomonadota bacterium]|jgi:hypothetical protein
MSDAKTSNRASREVESRGNSARRKPWAPPSRLDAPPAPLGYKHRWIRASAGGVEDRSNIAGRIREGYELVRGDEYPDFPVPTMEDGRHAGVISVGGLVLARIPEETVAERNSYYRDKANNQMQAADNELMKSNAHSSMQIERPSRRSRVSFGGSKRASE